jgi:bla regulator protein blaR1
MKQRGAWFFVVAAGMVVTLSAQGPAAFEVTSVKRAEPGIQGGRVQFLPGGRFSGENVPIDFVVQQVYGLRDFQVIVPSQLKAALAIRYQIQATGPESASQDQLKEMVKTLLAERFQLRSHKETRDLPVYALVVGKDGVKGARAADGKGMGIALMAPGWIHGQGATAAYLAETLSRYVTRPVINQTNLTQVLDFDLAWTPEGTASDLPGCPPSFQEMAKRLKGAVAPTSCPSLFTAVQEQLGLRLESQQGPVDVLVIDSVQQPADN